MGVYLSYTQGATGMRRAIMIALAAVLMVIAPVSGEEKPNLVRGEESSNPPSAKICACTTSSSPA
jgi:hypothetical protein